MTSVSECIERMLAVFVVVVFLEPFPSSSSFPVMPIYVPTPPKHLYPVCVGMLLVDSDSMWGRGVDRNLLSLCVSYLVAKLSTTLVLPCLFSRAYGNFTIGERATCRKIPNVLPVVRRAGPPSVSRATVANGVVSR